MLADVTKSVAARFGVLKEDAGVALRGTFIIDPTGTLQYAGINNLGIGRSVDETLRTLQAIQFFEEHGEVCPAGWQPGEEGIDVKAADKYFASVPDEGGPGAAYGAGLPTVATAADLEAATASAPAALVFVGATWCGKCKQLAPLVERLAADAGGRLKVVRLDADAGGGAADVLGVVKGTPLPSLRLFRGGKQVGSITGYKPAAVKAEVAKLLQQ
jgi:thiol-disulfide isomerase/thioredoxin